MAPLPKTPAREINTRIRVLKRHMANAGIEGIFLTHKPDIYYFSGTAQDCYLYIHEDHDPIMFVRRYLPRARNESCIKKIVQISSVTQIPDIIKKRHPGLPKTCGLAFDVVPVRDFMFYQHLFNPVVFMDAAPAIHACRQIKSAWEIDQIKQAAILSEKTFSYIRKTIEPGISEMEFCGKFETFSRKFGHSGMVLTRHYRAEGYPYHLLSGKSGGLAGAMDTPCCGLGTAIAQPFGASAKPIQRDEPIMIDFGTFLNGYHLDETRMVVMGTMPQKAMEASKIAIDILQTLVSLMKPGVIMGDLFDASVRMARKKGLEEHFLGLPGIKSIFIGHGIGLELVEPPIISKGKKQVLEPGMVFAVEPKFIFKDEFAAGIESVVQIAENNACFLSTTPHTVFVLN